MTPTQIQEISLAIVKFPLEEWLNKIAAILSRYADPGPGKEPKLVDDLVEACGNLQHWHDTHYGGMIVSGDSVRAIWQARAALEKELKSSTSAPPSQVEGGEPRCPKCGSGRIEPSFHLWPVETIALGSRPRRVENRAAGVITFSLSEDGETLIISPSDKAHVEGGEPAAVIVEKGIEYSGKYVFGEGVAGEETKMIKCAKCDGAGSYYVDGVMRCIECPRCKGSGEAPQPSGIEERAREYARPIVETWRLEESEPEDRRSFLDVVTDVAAAFAQQETAQFTTKLQTAETERDKWKDSISRLTTQREAGIAAERADCEKALLALSVNGYPTPAEGYGTNSSWAISDLCRAVKEIAAERDQWRKKCGSLEESAPWRVSDETIEKGIIYLTTLTIVRESSIVKP